ncbi:MAG: Mut7-C RNAse domain-containing protein [Haloarculaceae archaeon]
MTDRLLVDAMCGRLATYLRMCGHDAAYAFDRGVEADDELLTLAAREDRRLVTRDRDLAAAAPDAVLLSSRDIDGQLRELRDAGVRLSLPDEPTRCGTCNGPLERVASDAETPEGAPDPAREPVWRCRDCGQHFWRGSHWDDVAARLADL